MTTALLRIGPDAIADSITEHAGIIERMGNGHVVHGHFVLSQPEWRSKVDAECRRHRLRYTLAAENFNGGQLVLFTLWKPGHQASISGRRRDTFGDAWNLEMFIEDVRTGIPLAEAANCKSSTLWLRSRTRAEAIAVQFALRQVFGLRFMVSNFISQTGFVVWFATVITQRYFETVRETSDESVRVFEVSAEHAIPGTA